MTQTPGSVKAPGTEVVAQMALAPRKRSTPKFFRMVGAGAISAALVGVLAIPAYASPDSVGSIGTAEDAEQAFAQALTTNNAEIAVPAQLPTAEQKPLPKPVAPAWPALPAGVGAPGIVNAALAQVGMDKDCTDVAQDALAAVGIVKSRFSGGYDMGVGNFASLGTVYSYSPNGLAPGDLLVWPNDPHIAVYIGGGQAVHGGWHPTQIGGLHNWGGPPSYVVRVA